jgi:hypothetical protein
MLPSEEKEAGGPAYHRRQLDGLTLFEFIFTSLLSLTSIALLMWLGRDGIVFVFRLFLPIGAMLVVMFAWNCGRAWAPEATKYAMVLLVIGGVMFSLIPCWILQAREEARRNRCKNSLKQLGLAIHDRNIRSRVRPKTDSQPDLTDLFSVPMSRR